MIVDNSISTAFAQFRQGPNCPYFISIEAASCKEAHVNRVYKTEKINVGDCHHFQIEILSDRQIRNIYYSRKECMRRSIWKTETAF